jgi:hypothetical protein
MSGRPRNSHTMHVGCRARVSLDPKVCARCYRTHAAMQTRRHEMRGAGKLWQRRVRISKLHGAVVRFALGRQGGQEAW